MVGRPLRIESELSPKNGTPACSAAASQVAAERSASTLYSCTRTRTRTRRDATCRHPVPAQLDGNEFRRAIRSDNRFELRALSGGSGSEPIFREAAKQHQMRPSSDSDRQQIPLVPRGRENIASNLIVYETTHAGRAAACSDLAAPTIFILTLI